MEISQVRCTRRLSVAMALTLCAMSACAASAQFPRLSADSGLTVMGGQPKALQPTGGAPPCVVNSDWPVLPATGGAGPDKAYLVTSITIDGFEKCLSQRDIDEAEIEMDERPAGWGRPIARKVPLGALLRPVSPLCLYEREMQRIAETLVTKIKDRGFAGIHVQFVGPLDPVHGARRVSVRLATIGEVRVEDRRVVRTPEADPDSIRKDCPLKVGDYLHRSKLDATRDLLAARLHTDVDITISAQEGQEPGRAVLTIMLGPASEK